MKINYRPEIDGLRAIAVISVLIYHARFIYDNKIFLSGGFLGVDIFFVISGYLISRLIYSEYLSENKFSIINFYERRVRRIFPALFFVLFISSIASYFILYPFSQKDFAYSSLSSIFFFSNLFYWSGAIEYSASSQLLRPLLHTWSLSVEEQFYIFFPFFLIFILKYFREKIIFILIFVFLVSLAFSSFGYIYFQSLNFYILPSRSWELLAGTIVFLLEVKYKKKNLIICNLFNFLGIFLIIFSLIFFSITWPLKHPSFHTLPPIIGAMLLIYFAHDECIITKILSKKNFVNIGLLSYSLYLWHFPIFSFSRNFGIISENNFIIKIFLILISLLISYFSYAFIETNFRNRNKIKKNHLINFIFIVGSFLIIFNLSSIKTDGFKTRVPELFEKEFTNQKPWQKLKNDKGEACLNKINNFCEFNKSKGNKNILFIGDSISAVIAYDLKNKLKNTDYTLKTYLNAGCLYLPNFERINIRTGQKEELCSINYQNTVKEDIFSYKKPIIILSGRIQLYNNLTYFNNEEGGKDPEIDNFNTYKWEYEFKTKTALSFSENLITEVEKLSNFAEKIIIIYPIPEAGWDVPQELYKFIRKKILINKNNIENFNNTISTNVDTFYKRAKSSFDIYDKIKGDNIVRIYPHKIFCNTYIENRCATHTQNEIFYTDSSHLSIDGSSKINLKILKNIGKKD